MAKRRGNREGSIFRRKNGILAGAGHPGRLPAELFFPVPAGMPGLDPENPGSDRRWAIVRSYANYLRWFSYGLAGE